MLHQRLLARPNRLPRFRFLATSLLLVFVSGCATPTAIEADSPHELQRLVTVYEGVVADSAHDPKYEWVYGWGGNDQVTEDEEDRLRGLCYEWQELVYRHVHPIAERLDWTASMITVNQGWFSEHHAVLIHDAALGTPQEVLAERRWEAWVFDPWIDGKPQVYRLQRWVAIPWIVFSPAKIEDD